MWKIKNIKAANNRKKCGGTWAHRASKHGSSYKNINYRDPFALYKLFISDNIPKSIVEETDKWICDFSTKE